LRAVRRNLEGRLKAIEQEVATLERMATRWEALLPEERGRGRAPDIERRRQEQEQEQEQLFDGINDALVHFQSREAEVATALKSLSVEYHPVCLVSGCRTGARSFRETADRALAAIKKVVADCELAHGAPEAVLKFERMAVKMVATLEFVESAWRRRALAATDDPKQRYALEAWLAPAAYLERVSSRTTALRAHEIRVRVEEFRSAARASIGACVTRPTSRRCPSGSASSWTRMSTASALASVASTGRPRDTGRLWHPPFGIVKFLSAAFRRPLNMLPQSDMLRCISG
jgi:hypothetical protein